MKLTFFLPSSPKHTVYQHWGVRVNQRQQMLPLDMWARDGVVKPGELLVGGTVQDYTPEQVSEVH